jgi:hypothetical protein
MEKMLIRWVCDEVLAWEQFQKRMAAKPLGMYRRVKYDLEGFHAVCG